MFQTNERASHGQEATMVFGKWKRKKKARESERKKIHKYGAHILSFLWSQCSRSIFLIEVE